MAVFPLGNIARYFRSRHENVMASSTQLTKQLGLRAPIISAPMACVAVGALATAVSYAGGLGLIGGGYGDRLWIEREFDAAGRPRLGSDSLLGHWLAIPTC